MSPFPRQAARFLVDHPTLPAFVAMLFFAWLIATYAPNGLFTLADSLFTD